MPFKNTLAVFTALMKPYPITEILSSQDKRLIAALAEILPVVLPQELQATLSKKRIERIAATLLVELPVRQVHILRGALDNSTLLNTVSAMVQEYAQLITQVMSGKVQMSAEASARIKTQGLFKALEYMQMEHSSNNSQSQEEIDFTTAKRRGQLKALTRQMEYRSANESPEFIPLIPQEGPFTKQDYMEMEPAVNKSLKSSQIFNMWNQTPVAGAVRVQEVCSPENMLSITTAMFTMGVKPKNNVLNMPIAIVQAKEAWYRGNLKKDPIATSVMRGFNLIFGSVIEVPVLIVKSVLIDTGVLVGRMVGDCIRAKRRESEAPVVDVPDTIEPPAEIAYSYKQVGAEMVRAAGLEEKKVPHSDYVTPSLEGIHRHSKSYF